MVATTARKETPVSMRFRNDDLAIIDPGAALLGLSRTEFVRRAASPTSNGKHQVAVPPHTVCGRRQTSWRGSEKRTTISTGIVRAKVAKLLFGLRLRSQPKDGHGSRSNRFIMPI